MTQVAAVVGGSLNKSTGRRALGRWTEKRPRLFGANVPTKVFRKNDTIQNVPINKKKLFVISRCLEGWLVV